MMRVVPASKQPKAAKKAPAVKRAETATEAEPAGVSVVTLGVADIARARRFYCDGLGFKVHGGSDANIVFLDGGGIVLTLFPRHLLAEDAKLRAKGSGFGGVTLARNLRTKAAVDALLDKARKAGARILKPAQEVFWGGYSGYFADPDGYPWEVAYNPHWKLDKAGRLQLPK
jgi:prepilin-type processing-associated H-X9-DG protein